MTSVPKMGLSKCSYSESSVILLFIKLVVLEDKTEAYFLVRLEKKMSVPGQTPSFEGRIRGHEGA